MTDGGKYVCKASNVAGTTDIDLILKVLIPPTIDKSNIIGNPLAIVNRSIYLECNCSILFILKYIFVGPVSGIPQPTVRWLKDGHELSLVGDHVTIEQNNQTLGIKIVNEADQGRYTCVAEVRVLRK